MLAQIRTRLVTLGLAGMLLTGAVTTIPTFIPQTVEARDRYEREHRHRDGFNDEYVFATTRGLNDNEDIHPALKVTLFPVTILLDTVFLPFAVIAGFIS